VVKYKHNIAIVYPLVPAETAVICLLLLRGAQTPGELNTNAGRLYEFETIEEVQEILEKLSGGENPYLVQLPRRPGQKEARYMHLFGGMPDVDAYDLPEEPARTPASELEARIARLETEFSEMRTQFEKFMKEWNG
jgi:uncharacterized protein YceH (UPF0502 family)